MTQFEDYVYQITKILWHLDQKFPQNMLLGNFSWRERLKSHAKNLDKFTIVQTEALLDYIDSFKETCYSGEQ